MVRDLSVAVEKAAKLKRAFGIFRKAADFEQGATYSEVVKVGERSLLCLSAPHLWSLIHPAVCLSTSGLLQLQFDRLKDQTCSLHNHPACAVVPGYCLPVTVGRRLSIQP